jgi:uncharacterized protein (UPF0248 family)
MTKTNFMEKYPVNTITINKSDIKLDTVDDIIASIKTNIEAHPVAKHISTFDNYAHTTSQNGEIMEGMTQAKIIIFCFGSAIPNHKILAVRPRSIGVCEFEDRFVFDFMDAPKEDMSIVMAKWINSLKG